MNDGLASSTERCFAFVSPRRVCSFCCGFSVLQMKARKCNQQTDRNENKLTEFRWIELTRANHELSVPNKTNVTKTDSRFFSRIYCSWSHKEKVSAEHVHDHLRLSNLEIIRYLLQCARWSISWMKSFFRKANLNTPLNSSRLLLVSISSINHLNQFSVRARLQELAASGNLHNMNVFSPSMIRQLDLIAKSSKWKTSEKIK